jgi:hypothetical protein
VTNTADELVELTPAGPPALLHDPHDPMIGYVPGDWLHDEIQRIKRFRCLATLYRLAGGLFLAGFSVAEVGYGLRINPYVVGHLIFQLDKDSRASGFSVEQLIAHPAYTDQ